MLEAFNFAKREVAASYEREGIMVTEHPMLTTAARGRDADTDADGKQGRVASVITLGTAAPATRCRPIRSCARCTSSGARSSAGSKA